MKMRLVIKAGSANEAQAFAKARGFKVVTAMAAFTGVQNRRFIVQTRGASAADKAIAAAWFQESPKNVEAKVGSLLVYHTETERPTEGWVFRGSHNCTKCLKTVPYINKELNAEGSVCDNCAFKPESEAN
jgi:hypothetical protein